ncbi:hypothetical protein [Halocatena marina]|uniref:hypothetical protein n=1 Tax=Halocatena marina TaxID=2934937 RepID=UPI00200C7D5A|nr:hypothetical protein [Halocatena marina]
MTDCPHCSRTLGETQYLAVHAKVCDTDEDGLRIDLACVCAGCGGDILFEDVPADEGLIGTGYPGAGTRFEGRGYRV